MTVNLMLNIGLSKIQDGLAELAGLKAETGSIKKMYLELQRKENHRTEIYFSELFT